jgi:hypothetical protein
MVVIDVCNDCDEVELAWVDSNNDIAFSSFPAAALSVVH